MADNQGRKVRENQKRGERSSKKGKLENITGQKNNILAFYYIKSYHICKDNS